MAVRAVVKETMVQVVAAMEQVVVAMDVAMAMAMTVAGNKVGAQG